MILKAQVAISGASCVYDKEYTYLVPPEFSDTLQSGERVIVPFGRGSRKRIGIVLSAEKCNDGECDGYKFISALIDKEPVIGREMQEMLVWLRSSTFCTYFEAFRALIPPGLGVSCSVRYELAEISSEQRKELSREAAGLYASFEETENRREQEMMIAAAFEGKDKAAASELLSKGFLYTYDEVKRRVKASSLQMVRLTEYYFRYMSEGELPPKQKKVAHILEENGSASVKELCYLCGVSDRVVKNMLKTGAAEIFDGGFPSCTEEKAYTPPAEIILTDEQEKAFEGITKLIDIGKAACALLFGVTGSGKSLVFAKLIQHTLDMGKNVIMLIPEISLTPQTARRFTSLFGDIVSVIHSGLSMTARLDEYLKVKSGQARIVVGTRSAVFSPLENIGLVIMDEEGVSAYKSESAPRYNAADAAKRRCAYHNAVLVLASATPSLESYFFAEKGRYSLFTLKQRYGDRPLPKVEIVDMTSEELCGKEGLFSERLTREIYSNLSSGEQTVLLLNRRGFRTYISCTSCREPIKCPNCSIPLTYHKKNGRLMCHYCGYSTEMAVKCPSCGCEKLKMTGVGTQKLEDELSELFPSARVLRMDADTTFSGADFEKSLSAFGRGEYDILLGTQMIAKGLDFPNVTLVGVLSVDRALFCGDFRSYERTFSLITQAVGRGGRGGKAGRAYIQTSVPEHYIIALAAKQDYEEFYKQESAMRRALIYPPYCDICAVYFSCGDDLLADKASAAFLELLRSRVGEENVKFPLRVLGPARCNIEKIGGKYRYRIIIKCRCNAEFRSFLSEIRLRFLNLGEFSKVRTYIDINGDIGI